jgi:hypothetical protein
MILLWALSRRPTNEYAVLLAKYAEYYRAELLDLGDQNAKPSRGPTDDCALLLPPKCAGK